jgi:hypothetical protein
MTLLETMRSDQSNNTIAKAARDGADYIEELMEEIKALRARAHDHAERRWSEGYAKGVSDEKARIATLATQRTMTDSMREGAP